MHVYEQETQHEVQLCKIRNATDVPILQGTKFQPKNMPLQCLPREMVLPYEGLHCRWTPNIATHDECKSH